MAAGFSSIFDRKSDNLPSLVEILSMTVARSLLEALGTYRYEAVPFLRRCLFFDFSSFSFCVLCYVHGGMSCGVLECFVLCYGLPPPFPQSALLLRLN